MSKELLQVENLRVSYETYAGEVQSVRGVDFTVAEGETLAIVGESGCGKSVTARAVMRLIHKPGVIQEDSRILFDGEDVNKFTQKQLAVYRGEKASIIFQDAMVSLNPTMNIGRQITENILHHQKISKKEANEKAIELLKMVGISDPEKRIRQFPHELSGGMRQRVMIAIAFANTPRLLIADEPTTALDVTIQSQIMSLIRRLKDEHQTAVILITHDFGVVAGIADKIAVMYAGKIVERGEAEDIFYHPKHPYTKALYQAVPRIDEASGKELNSIAGSPPDLINPPKCCPFASRCPYCMNICQKQEAPEFEFEEGHSASCWLHALEKLPDDVEF